MIAIAEVLVWYARYRLRRVDVTDLVLWVGGGAAVAWVLLWLPD